MAPGCFGFDNDDETVFSQDLKFIDSARIIVAMIGMLSAIPSTPLHRRLSAAGRLDPTDHPAHGTNVIPLQMTREQLSDGYVRLMASLYEPEAFFRRLDDLYLHGGIDTDRAWQQYAAQRPVLRRWRNFRAWLEAFGLAARLLFGVPDGSLRLVYMRQFARFLRVRRNAHAARIYALKCAVHYHMHQMVNTLMTPDGPVVNTI